MKNSVQAARVATCCIEVTKDKELYSYEIYAVSIFVYSFLK
jgi:hypothetical protein